MTRSTRAKRCAWNTAIWICAATAAALAAHAPQHQPGDAQLPLRAKAALEIETPFLVKYTPGGARNFLVPSRLHVRKFYALAESPQLFKQLFMVRRLRALLPDRALLPRRRPAHRSPARVHADRHRAVSFVNQDDVFNLVEGLDVHDLEGRARHRPERALSRAATSRVCDFDESMDKYGNDKPDLRFDLPHIDLTDLVIEHDGGGIPFLARRSPRSSRAARSVAICRPEIVKAMVVPASANLSRTESTTSSSSSPSGMGAGWPGARQGWPRRHLDAVAARRRASPPRWCSGDQRGDGRQRGRSPGVPVRARRSLVHTVMANLRVHRGQEARADPGGRSRRRTGISCGSSIRRCSSTTTTQKSWAAAHHAFTRPHDESRAV